MMTMHDRFKAEVKRMFFFYVPVDVERRWRLNCPVHEISVIGALIQLQYKSRQGSRVLYDVPVNSYTNTIVCSSISYLDFIASHHPCE